MANISTYSFTDITATLSHPSYGTYSLYGEGIGDMTIAMTTDRSSHDVAADGSIMISKIAGNNGSVTINAQQTSSLHEWLLGLYNYCLQAATDEWAKLTLTVEAPKLHKKFYCSAGSFVKKPDEAFQSQGQRMAWQILFGDIQSAAA